MEINIVYAFISVIAVSLISVVFATPLLIKKKVSNHTLLLLLSLSVGVILGTLFFDFFPEIYHEFEGNEITVGIYILAGFLLMFIIEKFVHFHHHSHKDSHGHKHENPVGHSHAYSLAPLNLIGDGIHNFIDGALIGATYLIDVHLGFVVTIAVIFHEVPQEIADFGVLLYSGLSKKKALFFNFISAIFALLGTLLSIFLLSSFESFHIFILPFASGNFLYIAASNLLPQLHRHCGIKDTIFHIGSIILGITIILLLGIYGPMHLH